MKTGMDYSRAITAISMAKSEAYNFISFLMERRAVLSAEITKIDKFMESNPMAQIDGWYESIINESNASKSKK